MTVLILALLHGVPVFVIGVWTNSKAALTIAAIVASVIAVVAGASAFTAADLLAVAIGYSLGLSAINTRMEAERRANETRQREQDERDTRERQRLLEAEQERAARHAESQRRQREAQRKGNASAVHSHYDNLHVARSASEEVIRAAYRAQVQKYHPDKYKGPPAEALRITKILNEAYAVLSDPARRREHNEWIDSQVRASQLSMAATSNGHVWTTAPEAYGDDMSRTAPRNQPTAPSRNETTSSNSSWGWWLVALVVAPSILYILSAREPVVPTPVPNASPQRARSLPIPNVSSRRAHSPPDDSAQGPRTSGAPLQASRQDSKLRKPPPESRPAGAESITQSLRETETAIASIAAPPPIPVPESPRAQECTFSRKSSAQTSCPNASSQELRSRYSALIQQRMDEGESSSYWYTRHMEFLASASRCSTDQCVKAVMYEAIDDVLHENVLRDSPG